jgi:thiosulfate/3-mercaptopyruvate sulfurtransferase
MSNNNGSREVLVSTAWVAERLGDPQVHLIEVDEDTDAYGRGHIPGAVALHWKHELQDRVRRNFVDQATFEALLGRRGITENDTVVLYGGNNNWFAAYAYWYFQVYGHPDVRLIDGGRKKWELEGRELTAELPVGTPAPYRARPANAAIRVKRDEVVAGAGRIQMVDVRSPEEFIGKLAAPAHLPQEQAQKRGHIPGAKNLPWSKAVREDGTFKPVAELRELYENQLGLDPAEPTFVYCRIGERSSHTWFVLQELLGFREVRNYDGSWVEYGSLIDVPIELEYRPELAEVLQ